MTVTSTQASDTSGTGTSISVVEPSGAAGDLTVLVQLGVVLSGFPTGSSSITPPSMDAIYASMNDGNADIAIAAALRGSETSVDSTWAQPVYIGCALVDASALTIDSAGSWETMGIGADASSYTVDLGATVAPFTLIAPLYDPAGGTPNTPTGWTRMEDVVSGGSYGFTVFVIEGGTGTYTLDGTAMRGWVGLLFPAPPVAARIFVGTVVVQ